jgi:hypothetical protein
VERDKRSRTLRQVHAMYESGNDMPAVNLPVVVGSEDVWRRKQIASKSKSSREPTSGNNGGVVAAVFRMVRAAGEKADVSSSDGV